MPATKSMPSIDVLTIPSRVEFLQPQLNRFRPLVLAGDSEFKMAERKKNVRHDAER